MLYQVFCYIRSLYIEFPLYKDFHKMEWNVTIAKELHVCGFYGMTLREDANAAFSIHSFERYRRWITEIPNSPMKVKTFKYKQPSWTKSHSLMQLNS